MEWDLGRPNQAAWMWGTSGQSCVSRPPSGQPRQIHLFSDMFRTKPQGEFWPQRCPQDSKAGLLGVPAITNRQEQQTDPQREPPAGLVILTVPALVSSPALPGPESAGSDFVWSL